MYRHFERQREIFFIRGQAVDDRKHKRETRSPRALRASPFLYSVRSAALLSLPHWGRGTASAVDRVLSLAVICAKTFFHLHHPPFMPPVPYPPLRGTFPSRGRLTIRAYHPLTCGKAATTTLNPLNLIPPFLDFRSISFLISFCELHIINSMLFYHR